MAGLHFPPLLEIRPGEGRPFALAFAVFGLVIGAHTLVETARDTLFLSRLPPERLAYVYVSIAAGTLLLAPLGKRLVDWVGARHALVLTLLGSAFGIGWFRLQRHTESSVFALYVFGGLAITWLVAEFWLVASSSFTAAQGRRLFGPLAAGGVLGALIGAALSALLIASQGVDSLLVAASLGMVLAALVATYIEEEVAAPGQAVVASDPASPVEAPGGPGAVRREPLAGTLALLVALSTALSVVVDYVFKARAVSALDVADLGGFFARYQLGLSALTLGLQLLLARPLVARLGVLGLSLFSPSALLLGALATTLLGVPLLATLALRGLDSALRNSVQRVALELLWAPIEQRHKARAKTLVDGVVARGAQAAAAVALGALVAVGWADLTALSFLAAVLAALWLAVSLGVQRPYLEQFRRALGRGDLVRDALTRELDLTTVQALLEALARPDPDDVIAALNVLADRGRSRLIPALILYHEDERVLRRALELLAADDRRDWHGLAERLLGHRSLDVRLAALRALAVAGAAAPLERAAAGEGGPVRARAALHLAQLAGRDLRSDPGVRSALAATGAEGLTLRLALIDALGAHPGPQSTDLLLELGEDPALAGAVTAALASGSDPRALPFLIERLGTRRDRHGARRGLVGIGAPAQAELTRRLALGDPAAPELPHLPLSLARFRNAAAVAALLAALRSERCPGLVRYRALRGLHELARTTSLPIAAAPIRAEIARNASEWLRLLGLLQPLADLPAARQRTSLSLVVGLLEDKRAQAAERLERLVHIAQRTDDIPGVFRALAAADRHDRARAAEYLDALARRWERAGEPRLSPLLGLVFQERSDRDRVAAAAPLVGSPPASAEEALTRAAALGDQLLEAFAADARRALPPPQVPPALIGTALAPERT